MALIEYLERENWPDILRNRFELALESLRNDPFRAAGSAVDDLRSWLTAGGVACVRRNLSEQAALRQFPQSRQDAIDQLLQQIAHDNRRELLDLINAGTIPSADRHNLVLMGIDASAIEQILTRVLSGKRPFEEWMRAHGRSDEDILKVYRLVDDWLLQDCVSSGHRNPRAVH